MLIEEEAKRVKNEAKERTQRDKYFKIKLAVLKLKLKS